MLEEHVWQRHRPAKATGNSEKVAYRSLKIPDCSPANTQPFETTWSDTPVKEEPGWISAGPRAEPGTNSHKSLKNILKHYLALLTPCYITKYL